MLSNSFIVHETTSENSQRGEEYIFRENFHTQDFSNMSNLEGNDCGKENISIQWTVTNKNISFDPDDVVKKTNLRIEAAEFVPRCRLDGSTNVNSELTNVDQSAPYSSLGVYNTVPISEEFNKISWADETVDDNESEYLPGVNSNFNVGVSDSVPLIPENAASTRSFEEFVGTNINFGENAESLKSYQADSVDKIHSLEELNSTNRTEININTDRSDQNRDISDRYNRNSQPRQYGRNRNWKRDDARNDDNYRHKGKPRYSQPFKENFSKNRNEEQQDYRRSYPTNTSKQENESSYPNQENDTRPNRRYSDRVKNQDRYHSYDQRKNYQRSSPNFIKNKNEGPDKQGSTTEVKPKEEKPHTNGNTNDIKVKEETPDEIGTTADTWKSDRPKENYTKNQAAGNENEPKSNLNLDEDNYKRNWSDRQSFGNKEVEEPKTNYEEKGAKPRNKNFQEGKFRNSRGSSNKKPNEKPHVDSAVDHNLKSTENIEQPKERKSKFYQNTELKNRKSETNSHYQTPTAVGFDEEKHNRERAPRRSLDTSKSLKYKTKDQYSADRSYNESEDKTRSYRRSFNKDETEKRPEKSFRDALFAEKKNNDKPRDLKQERGGARAEKSAHYENFRNRSTAEPSIDNLVDKKHAETDPEYKEFLQELKDKKINVTEKIREQNQDLFKMPNDYSLAHCVAEDMRMGSGIAVTFRDTFANVDVLLNAKVKAGSLVTLKEGPRFLYYLVTKKRSRDKPTYKDFWCSMKCLRDHIKKLQVPKLAVPTLGCGLDQLNWPTVKHMLGFLFKDVPVDIVVCHFSPTEESAPRNSIKIHRKNENLKDARESIIVYFTTADSYISDEMNELNQRFPFLTDFQKAAKSFGTVVQSKVSHCMLCGCVVRKTVEDPFNYKSFSSALSKLNGIIADKNCDAIALQYLKDEQDDLVDQKIITVILNYLKNANVIVYLGDKDVSFGDT